MGKEIERKFLVKGEGWRSLAKGTRYRQGYLNSAKERTVRIRTIEDKAFLTIKGLTVGATRMEYEYEIPVADCDTMLDTLAERPLIEKKRYRIDFGGLTWEVDEFFGENAGLVVAEVELPSEDQAFRKPDWVSDEVTGDPRYFNANLIKHPYCRWASESVPDSSLSKREAPMSELSSSSIASSAEGAAKAVPRAEFRVFGPGVVDIVKQRMWDARATLEKARKMPPETYLLSVHTDEANVKVRNGLLDIKTKVGQTAEGYEIFQPQGKFQFPVKREELAAILSHLGVEMTLDKETCRFDEFMAMARQHPDLVPVSVEKMRYGFTVEGIICEYAQVWINGAMVESACCESENYADMGKVIEALGIAAMPNTSYIKEAKRVVGMA